MKILKQSVSSLSLSPYQFTTNAPSIQTLVGHGLYSQALRASATLLDVCLTDQIYSLFKKSGVFLDIFLGTYLVDCFSKSGHLSHAHRFLQDMPQTDVVAWNTLISGYARALQTESAFRLFYDLKCFDLKPDAFTISSLIKACSNSQDSEIAHAIAIKMGFASGAYICSSLVDNYSKSWNIRSARKCFEECLDMDTVVWTTMISGYIWNGEPDKAFEIFIDMRLFGVDVNQFSLTNVLGAISVVREGEQVHGLSIKTGLLASASTPLKNAILSMYCRCGSKTDGIKMFDEISDPDVISWTARIGATSDGKEAVELLNFLRLKDTDVNEYTLVNALSAIGSSRLLKSGQQIQAHCLKAGFSHVIHVGNALISMYGKCQCTEEANKAFDEMLHHDCVSWNALISAFAENDLEGSALAAFSKMQLSSLKPTKFTLASMFEVLSNLGALECVNEFHALIIKFGYDSDDSMITCLIWAYAKCGEIENSKCIFSEIEQVYMVHINALASAFVHSGYHADLLKLFQEACNSEVEVNGIIFSLVLKACGAFSKLEEGKSIHSLILKYGIYNDYFVGSAIVDVYCKCGSINDAKKAFDELPKENLATWNAMIMGNAQHGHSQEVFRLFSSLTEIGLFPDEITYLGVLYSCCHSGLVNEAYSVLNFMLEYSGMIPQLEHYACLVDLLCRVGNLEEAKRTIDQMPICPDAHIWQILLSACSIHGNIELGRIAAMRLLELEPDNDSAYVLLANLYASSGIWNEVGKVRKEMKGKSIGKEPGASWIQLRGAVHSFFAHDTSHVDSSQIHLKLQELYEHMSAASHKEEMTFD
ncbi:hypothetical protein Scep_029056 [Stephania cephalantha]|uniref:Pentatricopeptide repeat-containing protein n=1 Tax=Stephania cephalantha TaxID=152367 RepID=A0AAP0DWV4_9MAGN